MSIGYNNYTRKDLLASNLYKEDFPYNYTWVNEIIHKLELYNIKTSEDAEKYIDSLLDTSNILEVARIFYGYKHNELKMLRKKINRQRGGNTLEQFKLYELLAKADSMHDFKSAAYDLDDFIDYLPVEVTKADIIEYDRNSEILVFNETRFIDTFSKIQQLTFLDENGIKLNPIANPFYKIDFRNYPIDIKTLKNDTLEYNDLYSRYIQTVSAKKAMPDNRNLSIEIWAPLATDELKKKKRNRIELSQIAYLCSTVSEMYKNYSINGIYEFQIDNQNNDLINMIVSVKLLNSAFHKKISIYGNNGISYSTAELINQMALIYEQNGIRQWDVTTSDANIFDPADNNINIKIDRRPTGDIYKYSEKLGYQITLDGINDNKTVNIVLQPTLGNFIVKEYDKKMSSVINRIGNINNILNTTEVPRKQTSDKYQAEIRTYIPYTREFKMALKRAGDWSQVMHAKKYNKIFITSDRLAALFAAYNSIPYILFREDYYTTEIENGNREDRPSLLQASFILG